MAEASSASPSLIANGLGEGAGTVVGEGVGVGEGTTARNSDAGGVSALTTRPSLRFVSVAGISLTIAVPNAVASIAPIEAVYELFVEARSLVGTSTSILYVMVTSPARRRAVPRRRATTVQFTSMSFTVKLG